MKTREENQQRLRHLQAIRSEVLPSDNNPYKLSSDEKNNLSIVLHTLEYIVKEIDFLKSKMQDRPFIKRGEEAKHKIQKIVINPTEDGKNNPEKFAPIHLEPFNAGSKGEAEIMGTLVDEFKLCFDIVKEIDDKIGDKKEFVKYFVNHLNGNCIDARTVNAFKFARQSSSPSLTTWLHKTIAGMDPSLSGHYFQVARALFEKYWDKAYLQDETLKLCWNEVYGKESVCPKQSTLDMKSFPIIHAALRKSDLEPRLDFLNAYFLLKNNRDHFEKLMPAFFLFVISTPRILQILGEAGLISTDQKHQHKMDDTDPRHFLFQEFLGDGFKLAPQTTLFSKEHLDTTIRVLESASIDTIVDAARNRDDSLSLEIKKQLLEFAIQKLNQCKYRNKVSAFLETYSSGGFSLLHKAVDHDDPQQVTALMRLGANIYTHRSGHHSSMSHAAYYSKLQSITKFLELKKTQQALKEYENKHPEIWQQVFASQGIKRESLQKALAKYTLVETVEDFLTKEAKCSAINKSELVRLLPSVSEFVNTKKGVDEIVSFVEFKPDDNNASHGIAFLWLVKNGNYNLACQWFEIIFKRYLPLSCIYHDTQNLFNALDYAIVAREYKFAKTILDCSDQGSDAMPPEFVVLLDETPPDRLQWLIELKHEKIDFNKSWQDETPIEYAVKKGNVAKVRLLLDIPQLLIAPASKAFKAAEALPHGGEIVALFTTTDMRMRLVAEEFQAQKTDNALVALNEAYKNHPGFAPPFYNLFSAKMTLDEKLRVLECFIDANLHTMLERKQERYFNGLIEKMRELKSDIGFSTMEVSILRCMNKAANENAWDVVKKCIPLIPDAKLSQCHFEFLHSIRMKQPEIARAFLSRTALSFLNCRFTPLEEHALDLAIKQNDTVLAAELIKLGFDKSYGKPPVTTAVEYDDVNLKTLGYLLKREEIKVNPVWDSKSALFLAIEKKNIPKTQLLLEHIKVPLSRVENRALSENPDPAFRRLYCHHRLVNYVPCAYTSNPSFFSRTYLYTVEEAKKAQAALLKAEADSKISLGEVAVNNQVLINCPGELQDLLKMVTELRIPR